MWKYLVGTNNSIASKSGYEFKMKNPFEQRKMESKRVMDKFTDKIPIVLEKSDTSTLPEIDKKKFVVPYDITIGEFLHIVRKKLKISTTDAIFLLINNNTIPHTGSTIKEIYNKYADKDGFLYVTYSSQQAFGI